MHELLAPIIFVLARDAVTAQDVADASLTGAIPETMGEILDRVYLEHDAYALFERLMVNAAEFYSIDAADPTTGGGLIVDKSRLIHEQLLRSVDPELADHFTAIEVLPQIFLMSVCCLLRGGWDATLQLHAMIG